MPGGTFSWPRLFKIIGDTASLLLLGSVPEEDCVANKELDEDDNTADDDDGNVTDDDDSAAEDDDIGFSLGYTMLSRGTSPML